MWIAQRNGNHKRKINKLNYIKIKNFWDFPGGPMADSMLPNQGARVQSLVRELDPGAAKQINK